MWHTRRRRRGDRGHQDALGHEATDIASAAVGRSASFVEETAQHGPSGDAKRRQRDAGEPSGLPRAGQWGNLKSDRVICADHDPVETALDRVTGHRYRSLAGQVPLGSTGDLVGSATPSECAHYVKPLTIPTAPDDHATVRQRFETDIRHVVPNRC